MTSEGPGRAKSAAREGQESGQIRPREGQESGREGARKGQKRAKRAAREGGRERQGGPGRAKRGAKCVLREGPGTSLVTHCKFYFGQLSGQIAFT